MNTTRSACLALGVVGSLAISACSLDVGDLNNPGLDQLQNHPDAVSVGAACTGLLLGDRVNRATENGVVVQLGILGREAYNFDAADPRYIGELLQGPLNPGGPFGGGFWLQPYANVRLANVILHAVDKVDPLELDATQKMAIRGFVHTMEAVSLLQIIVTHDTNGAVIDTDRDVTQPLGPIVDRDTVYGQIASLLDGALTELGAGGKVFPFLLSDGYAGFDKPTTFVTFNRAIRARAAAYTASAAAPAARAAAYQPVLDALAASFVDDNNDARPPDLNVGVYYSYSTAGGDLTSALINPNIYAHPALATDAAKSPATKAVDLRFTAKVATAEKAGAAMGVASTLQFTPLYPGPASRVALIRNEELVLLRAEALWFTGQKVQAMARLNLVREQSGGLDQLPVPPDDATFVNELLYERRYSLLFEGGHRWIDLRRFGVPLPLDQPEIDVRNVRFPIPLSECNARPNEPRCSLGST